MHIVSKHIVRVCKAFEKLSEEPQFEGCPAVYARDLLKFFYRCGKDSSEAPECVKKSVSGMVGVDARDKQKQEHLQHFVREKAVCGKVSLLEFRIHSFSVTRVMILFL